MLTHPYRLPRSQFPQVLKTGFRKPNPFINLVYAPVPQNIADSRFGIIVSTKVSKLAVKRNLLKRRLRHAIMSAISDLKSPVDAVIIAKPGSLNQPIQVFVDELRRLFYGLPQQTPVI